MVRELPPDSLPLRFLLEPCLSRSSGTPCACLVVDLPVRRGQQDDSPVASSSAVKVEDVRVSAQRPCIAVYRVLDPEHKEPFVSLGRVFAACSITPVQGLLRFKLGTPQYDLSLGGIAPFTDLWTPLETARRVVKGLGCLDELEALLEWNTRSAYTIEDKEEGGLVHNWRIASDRIAPPDYSTASMLKVTFPRIHLLHDGHVIRTLCPKIDRREAAAVPRSYDELFSRIVQWSSLEVEGLTAQDERDLATSSTSPPAQADYSSTSTWYCMTGMLALQKECSSLVDRDGDSLRLLPSQSISKEAFLRSSESNLRRLATVDFLAHLVIRDWHQRLHDTLPASPESQDKTTVERGDRLQAIEEKMAALERRLQTIEENNAQPPHSALAKVAKANVTRNKGLNGGLASLDRAVARLEGVTTRSAVESDQLTPVQPLSMRETVLIFVVAVLLGRHLF